MFTVSPGGIGGGGGVRVYSEEARDTKVSSVAAPTTSLGRRFQSLIVLGRKEELLYPYPSELLYSCAVFGLIIIRYLTG